MIVSRVLASLAHLGLVLELARDRLAALRAADHRHGDGRVLSVASLHADGLVDSGQLVPAALIVAAVFWHLRPALAGALIGLAAGWIPACLGLIALWCGFFRGRGAVRFTVVALAVVIGCALLGYSVPELGELGTRPGRPQHRRGRPVAAVRATDPPAASG